MNESVITLTPPAVEMVKRIRAKDGLSKGMRCRVAVVGGGCSGSAIRWISTTRRRSGDEIVEYEGVQVGVDPTSAQYLRGIEIDYVNSLSGGGFKFINPNAKHTCGCGSSFSA